MSRRLRTKGAGAGQWELSCSSAGHLPPLLTTQNGEARYLEEGGGLMLGTGFDLPRPGATQRSRWASDRRRPRRRENTGR